MNPAFRIALVDALQNVLKQCAEALFRTPQRMFREFALGDVGHHRQRARSVAAFERGDIAAGQSPKLGAVPAPQAPVELLFQTCSQIFPPNALREHIGREKELVGAPPDQPVGGYSEHLCHSGVGPDDRTRVIQNPDALRRRFYQLAMPGLAAGGLARQTPQTRRSRRDQRPLGAEKQAADNRVAHTAAVQNTQIDHGP